jgi:organic hydroperoxide reductase OsmC/OhrA
VAASKDRLVGHATGEVELEGKVLVLKRIHVRLELRCSEEHREVAERVHGFFAEACPLYRSLRAAIGITTELAIVPG